MADRIIQLPILSIRALVNSKTLDDEARTVELIFATGTQVVRRPFFGEAFIEELSIKPSHVRLARLNQGAPLLDSHNACSVNDQLGAVVPESAKIVKGEARATVQFSKRESVEPVWQDVRDGIVRNVSVAYHVHKFEETAGKDGSLPIRKAVDWEPFEISMVPLPADPNAQVRDGIQPETTPCVIITREVGDDTMADQKPNDGTQLMPAHVFSNAWQRRMTSWTSSPRTSNPVRMQATSGAPASALGSSRSRPLPVRFGR